MSEYEKIQEVMKKHEEYFRNGKADIAISSKGRYFFFEFDTKYQNFETFIEFQTAEELEKIILSTVADDLDLLLAIIGDNVAGRFRDLDVESAKDWYNEGESITKAIKRLVAFTDDLEEYGSWLKNTSNALLRIAESIK